MRGARRRETAHRRRIQSHRHCATEQNCGAYGGNPIGQGGGWQPHQATGRQGRSHQKGARRGHSAHRDSGRPGGIPLVPGTAGCRLGQSLHPLHLRTLRDEQKRQAGNGHGESSG